MRLSASIINSIPDKHVLIFAPLEPFAVADSVDNGDEDEDEADFAVDSSCCGMTVNQPLRYCRKSCQGGECNQYCKGFGGS